MKHIVKQAEPQEFTNWKALANEDWQPTYGTLNSDVKKIVKRALMQEQGHICCYCERRLEDNDSHIEHLEPQSTGNIDPLDYDNMLCSCQNQLAKGDRRHCGVLKDDWFDDALLISPLDSECETRFSFDGDGLIKPAREEDDAATKTISMLGLDLPKLNSMREDALAPFLDEALTTDEFQDFVTGYLQQDSNGMFGQFWTTINYLFGGLACP